MTPPRAPDRYEEKARELIDLFVTDGTHITSMRSALATALRAETSETLDAVEAAFRTWGDATKDMRDVFDVIADVRRALASPAAPAAEPRLDNLAAESPAKVLRHVTPRAKIVGNYICKKCEHHDHSDHIPGWGGICVGCACEWLPPSGPAAACTCRYLNCTRFENYGNCPVHPSEPAAPAPRTWNPLRAALQEIVTMDSSGETVARARVALAESVPAPSAAEKRIAELEMRARQDGCWHGEKGHPCALPRVQELERVLARVVEALTDGIHTDAQARAKAIGVLDAALVARAATQKGEGK